MEDEDPNQQEHDGTPSQMSPLEAEAHGYTLFRVSDREFMIKVSRRRWAVVLVFSCYSMCNAFQWIQYGAINNIFMHFYGVSSFAIDWLSMCYMLAYIPLFLPGAWLLENFSLRTIALTGSALNSLGAWVKLGSLQPHLFPVTMLGQVVCSVAQVFILGMPSPIASVWFRDDEVSTACSIAVLGNQLGNAFGFLVPAVSVPSIYNPDELAYHISIMFYITAGVATLLFILVIIVFKEKPKHPPSRAQCLSYTLASTDASYLSSIIRFFKNFSFVLLVITYGLNAGAFYALCTLLNRMVIFYYPGLECLDGKKDNRQSHCTEEMGSCPPCPGSPPLPCFCDLVVSVSITGYLTLGFEFAVELTYPESEVVSSGLLNVSAQVFGIIFTISQGQIIDNYGTMPGNIFLCVFLTLGAVLTDLGKWKS
ncbi:hypothetical protein JEQ12_018488 [Ovis aries]|uniref:Feline leukemia virus subgroup C receptor-related protein 2-like n=1 Tax=Ovis aries TaxID=9940 RepID=A0A836A3B6_SHEEP|nr:hypothetical protein JEQ12_018488 [Ovis aries]